ncbi:MAG: S41 family peptidase [Bacteroidia bacterium]|nr:S41 family peptidase [Bacteroidia bacterium]
MLRTLTLLSAAILLSSCEQLFLKPEPGTAPSAIFDEAWTFVDREYAFFKYKGIDWNEVRSRYEPLISDGMSEEDLFDVLASMLYELRDGHVNLSSDFDISRNWTWYLNSPQNFNFTVLERGYFQEKEQYAGPFILYDFGDVGYMRYASFASTVTPADLDYVLEKFADRKGLIIDIRDNDGGSLANVNLIASRFTETEVTIGSWSFKSGPGHEDFTPLEDIVLEPAEGLLGVEPKRFTKPVVVLMNRSSYSAANFFPLYMKALPQVTLMGDTSGGGGGAPANTQLANGWVLRCSSSRLFDPQGFNVENGIPPDVRVDLDPADEAAFRDTMLELALFTLRR